MNTEQNIYDVAVVGGGIIGLTIALSLRRSGVEVLLLEKNTVCGGASGGNAGHIATEQIFPIASPDVLKQLPRMLTDPLSPLRLDWHYLPLMIPWFARLLMNMRPERFKTICTALQALNRESLFAWETFSEEWGLNDWVHIRGSMLTAESNNGIVALKKHGEKLNTLGVCNHFLSAAQMHEYEPALSASQQGALFFPNTGHIANLQQTAYSLADHLRHLNGHVIEQAEVTNIVSDGFHWLLTCPGQSFKANQIVIAAGAFSKTWAQKLGGVNVPLDTERGYHMMLPNMCHTLNIPVSSYERKFIMTPMDTGLRLAGTVEFAGLHRPPDMRRAKQLSILAAPMLDIPLSTEEATVWMGFRPSITDSLPVIDRCGSVYFAFGHQHLGLTQAPLTAKLITNLYHNHPISLDMTPYRLNRF